MARIPPEAVLAIVSFHPQRGGMVSLEPVAPALWKYKGGRDSDWRHITRVYVIRGGGVVPGQALPKGFLWGDLSKQNFTVSGHMLYGPIEKTCRDCGEPFVWSARAQQQLYEVARAFTDVFAKQCRTCARKRNKLEAARKAYAAALAAAEGALAPKPHLDVARATLELVKAGGKARLDRAIGHCRKARRLGAGPFADRIEAQLIARR